MNKLPLRAGRVRGDSPGVEIPVDASQVFKSWSGKFVKKDSSNGFAEVAGDGAAELLGWLNVEAYTSSASAGADVRQLFNGLDDVFEMPLRYDASTYDRNYSDALIGKTCDLVVISDVQYANLATSTEDTLIIVGGTAASSSSANDGIVKVKLNPAKIGADGVE